MQDTMIQCYSLGTKQLYGAPAIFFSMANSFFPVALHREWNFDDGSASSFAGRSNSAIRPWSSSITCARAASAAGAEDGHRY